MNRQGAKNSEAGLRARAVARLSTLQRLRDDALAKNRQAMLQTIEAMIVSEMRSMNTDRQEAAASDKQDAPSRD